MEENGCSTKCDPKNFAKQLETIFLAIKLGLVAFQLAAAFASTTTANRSQRLQSSRTTLTDQQLAILGQKLPSPVPTHSGPLAILGGRLAISLEGR
jgi:hypothetical protein